jgi:hypothetical protein
MRAPSDRHAAWNWWRQSVTAGFADEPITTEPRCGLFRTRGRGGNWVAASIDLHQVIAPDTGELMEDEVLVCLVDGRPRDPGAAWPYLADHPISDIEHGRLSQQRKVTDLAKQVIV